MKGLVLGLRLGLWTGALARFVPIVFSLRARRVGMVLRVGKRVIGKEMEPDVRVTASTTEAS